MKIYRIDNDYFEVVDKKTPDNLAGVILKVNRRLTGLVPTFSFGYDQDSETYYTISMARYNDAVEVTEEEFQKVLLEQVKNDWNEVKEIQKRSNGAFMLPVKATNSRYAYMSTFNISRQDFFEKFLKEE